jgi:hypothetical protein
MNAHDKWLQAPYETSAIDHEALQAEIASEADARLIEWQSIEAASRDVYGYELLQNELDFIISYAAKHLGKEDRDSAMLALGRYVAAKVQRAAIEVATHVCTEKS